MLNKELSHFAESSKSGTQISQFIIHTYMDKDDDELQPEVELLLHMEFFFYNLIYFLNLPKFLFKWLNRFGRFFFQLSSSEPLASTSTPVEETTHKSLLGKAKTAAMSRISGVRKLRSPRGGHIPEYGIEGHKELAVHMQMVKVNIILYQILEIINCFNFTQLKEHQLFFCIFLFLLNKIH